MREGAASYSSLSPDEQAAISVWIEGFENRFGQTGPAALEQTLEEAPKRLRMALLSQLLPMAIGEYRQQHGVMPTLHELRLSHPNLAAELSEVYPALPASYRLPVELGGYRVIRVVGNGGQAVVLRAQDDVHSTVAIKLSTSPQHNELLLRERRLLGECEHPGIVPVIGSGMHEGSAYYVMPYLKGKTLADRYTTHRPEADEATRIASELCGIVEHLHGLGILHRDIKPANVWVDDHGGVKLIDLGMAVERSRWGQPLSHLREFHGTPAFMSPEQAATDGERDGELSDVFSIGATLYWLGTGLAPFDASSGEIALNKAAEGQFDRDCLVAIASWPKQLVNACLRAMAVAPSQRYHSARAMRESLEAIQFKNPAPRWKRFALLPLLLLIGISVLVYSKGQLQLLSSRRPPGIDKVELQEPQTATVRPDSDPIEAEPDAELQEQPVSSLRPDSEPIQAELDVELQEPQAPSVRHDSHSIEDEPPPKERTELDRLMGNSDPTKPLAKAVLPKPQTLIFWMPEPRIANYEVEQFIKNATPRLPALPDLDFSLSAKQKSINARAWLASLSPGTKMGHLAGIRFHPTPFVPIGPALNYVKVVYEARNEPGGPLVLRSIVRKDFGNLQTPPTWVYEGITRPLTEDDQREYATDTSESQIPLRRSFIMQVPPGLRSVSIYAEFRDGSRTPTYEIQNDDFTLARQLFPLSTVPQGMTFDAYLFLYRTATMDRANGLVRYLDKPLDANAPFRGRLERTRFGFYVTPPEGVHSITVVNSSSLEDPETEIKPGSFHVTYEFSNMVVSPITFQVPAARFEELANDALTYSKLYHAE